MPRPSFDQRSDAELVLADDPYGFATLFERHADWFVGYFYRRTGDPEIAADLTAETFAAAFASRHRFRDTGAPARAWLLAIAARQLSHFIRREVVANRYRRRLGVETRPLSAVDIERIEALADLPRLRTDIAAAWATLPTDQAHAVALRVIEERSYAEIADLVGCSPGAARVRVCRGLSQLANHLEAP